MLIDFLPFQFQLNVTTLAGISLWSLALYLGLFPVSEWVMERLTSWMNEADRSLYTPEEFEKTRKGRESLNAFYASLLSILPFLVLGSLFNWGVAESLGQSWTISTGIIAAIGCGIYELGRRDGQSAE